jgi:tetratricopeptide (TPR) repeat protein
MDEALGLLDRAADLLEEIGNWNGRALALTEAGFLALEAGDARKALAVFDAAAARDLTPDLAFRAVEGMALALALEGQIEGALSVLARAQLTHGWSPESAESVRLVALQGRVALAARRESEARTLLHSALLGFLRLGLPLDAALAGVRLARALLTEPAQQRLLTEIASQLGPLAAEISEPARAALERLVQDILLGQKIAGSRLLEVEQRLEAAKRKTERESHA